MMPQVKDLAKHLLQESPPCLYDMSVMWELVYNPTEVTQDVSRVSIFVYADNNSGIVHSKMVFPWHESWNF